MTKPCLENANPFCKALAVLISAVLLSFSYSVWLNLLVLFLSLGAVLLFSRASKKKIVLLFLPVLLLAVGFLVTGLFYSDPDATGYTGSIGIAAMSVGSFYNGLQLATRIFAFAGLGILFSMTTSAQEFITSLQHQAKLPPKFAYGILAAVHLLPNIQKEYRNARQALQVRGVASPFSLKPVFIMFVNAIRWSECLAMAMESKGFSEEGERTYYHQTVVRKRDVIFTISICIWMTVGIFLLP